LVRERSTVQSCPAAPAEMPVIQGHLALFGETPPELPGFISTMSPSDSHHSRRPEDGVEAATLAAMGLPRFTDHLPGVPCPLPRRIEWVHISIASPFVLPSPLCRRVGIRDFTFEACSGFTHVTARRVARPPTAAFVTRLRSSQLTQPNRSSATTPIDNCLGGFFLHWLSVPFGAHCMIQASLAKI